MEKVPCKRLSLWKRLFLTESPFGEGSLQSYDCMEKALKGFPFGRGSFVKVVGFPHGKRSLEKALCKAMSLWKRLFVKGFPCFLERLGLLAKGFLYKKGSL